LARDGQWPPCPSCDANSLFIDRQAWCVFCVLCKARWHWGTEVRLLGEIANARALEIAQEVANDLAADAGQPDQARESA
jgi:hypothetical protein